MPLGLGKLWARLTGLKDWDQEVRWLKNTTDDDTPPPGVLPGRPVPTHNQDHEPLSKAELRQRYEEWEGEDPGH
jgi:hypothetical protein